MEILFYPLILAKRLSYFSIRKQSVTHLLSTSSPKKESKRLYAKVKKSRFHPIIQHISKNVLSRLSSSNRHSATQHMVGIQQTIPSPTKKSGSRSIW